jgi:hypothetical protein
MRLQVPAGLKTSLAFAFFLPMCFGQWQPAGASTGPIYYNGGNVGIGMSNPNANLSVAGTISASGEITANGPILANDFIWWPAQSGYQWWVGDFIDASGSWQVINRQISTGTWSAPLTVLTSGNVGVGTSSPQHLLHVAGTIGAEEVIVSSTGADYVFEPGYHLRPLAEVADYVKENHRLPEVPSAKEMQEKGASLGDLQTKLLAKIEELTLYAIQAEERSGRLERENRELREAIREIKERIDR